MRPVCLGLLLAVLLNGCGEPPQTLVGGKSVTYWVEALHDADARQRKTAVSKLGNVGPADSAVLPALLEALGDPDAAVRREAIVSLMKYGPAAREAVPTLDDLRQRDPDVQVRDYAAKGLEKLRRGE
jgi:HEAT repeat protein